MSDRKTEERKKGGENLKKTSGCALYEGEQGSYKWEGKGIGRETDGDVTKGRGGTKRRE